MALTAHIRTNQFRSGLTKWTIGAMAMLLALLVIHVPFLPAEDELPHFDVLGKIDEIQSDWVIVNDTIIRNDGEFPPEYVRESDRIRLTRSSFQKGDFVGVEQNGIGRLKSLWKFDAPLD